MTYEQALHYIHSIPRPGPKRDRSRMESFLHALGDPQEGLRILHVAGTNGKGSTCQFLASVLTQAGLRAGLFLSPYIHEFRERMTVCGEKISQEELARRTEQLAAWVEAYTARGGVRPGEFEFVTALALQWFADQKCDFVVLETGMGGLLDATNCASRAEVSVITPIALDHTQYLGETLAEIAAHKAGIFKPGCPCVTAYGQPPEVLEVLEATAERLGCPFAVAREPESVALDLEGARFTWGGRPCRISLPGAHQVQNAAAALAALETLAGRGVRLPWEAVARGLELARSPGRLEVVGTRPLRLLDGGHNPAAVAAACRSLKLLAPVGKLYTVMGMMGDKDYLPCISRLARRSAAFFGVSSGLPRALTPEEVAHTARPYCKDCTACASLEEAVALARGAAGPEDTILVCGSLYLLDPAERLLR